MHSDWYKVELGKVCHQKWSENGTKIEQSFNSFWRLCPNKCYGLCFLITLLLLYILLHWYWQKLSFKVFWFPLNLDTHRLFHICSLRDEYNQHYATCHFLLWWRHSFLSYDLAHLWYPRIKSSKWYSHFIILFLSRSDILVCIV